ncbi:MAG: hypothetical protein ACYSWQ_25490, partial [Planctomycetota bacterium]
MKSTGRNSRCWSFRNLAGIALVMLLLAPTPARNQTPELDERPAEPGEWGCRPAGGAVLRVNPPAFSWRPQAGFTWDIEWAPGKSLDKIAYRASGLKFNVHCPPRTLEPGTYTWRYRGKDK